MIIANQKPDVIKNNKARKYFVTAKLNIKWNFTNKLHASFFLMPMFSQCLSIFMKDLKSTLIIQNLAHTKAPVELTKAKIFKYYSPLNFITRSYMIHLAIKLSRLETQD